MASENWPVYLLIALNALLLAWLGWQEARVKKLLRGKGARDLENSITTLMQEVDALKALDLDARVKKGVAFLETKRFNAFADAGGNQSFASAFLDEEGSGVIISSLYTREKCTVFAKPITRYASLYTLTDEEKEVILLCKQKKKI